MKHEDQKDIWNQEHKNPTVLKQMDSSDASSGVQKFWNYLVSKNEPRSQGVEMGCGKGRNVSWLAQHGVEMHGFDFSPAAINEAKSRAKEVPSDSALLQVADATEPWPHE